MPVNVIFGPKSYSFDSMHFLVYAKQKIVMSSVSWDAKFER